MPDNLPPASDVVSNTVNDINNSGQIAGSVNNVGYILENSVLSDLFIEDNAAVASAINNGDLIGSGLSGSNISFTLSTK